MRVLVTGASGGIGDAIAACFASQGAKLALHAGRGGERLRARVAEAGWSDAQVVEADLADAGATETMVEAAADALGGLDICIANAGIWPGDSPPLRSTPIARIERVLQVNLFGAIHTSRAFLRLLARRGPRDDGRGASICYVGSTAGRFGEAGHTTYSVSKAGMYGLVRSLKNEIVAIDPYGRVNMVEPGWTVTPMAEAALEEPGVIEGVLRTMPLRQLARAEDIARAIVVLSSPHLSRHTSGEVLTIAGGMEGRVQWDVSEIDPDAVRRRLKED